MIRTLELLSVGILLCAALLVACDQEPEEAETNPSVAGRSEAKQRLAFVSNRDGAYRLYTMNPDGGDIRMLSEKPVASISPFSVSPDGTQLAFLGGDESGSESPCVYRVDVMGGRTELIGQVPPDASSPLAMPAPWRADDLAVLVSGYEACYAVPSAGGEVREEGVDKCLETAVLAEGPLGRLAAVGGAGLMLFEEIGSTPRILDETSVSEGEEGLGWDALFLTGLQWMGALRPVWSPDGERIAYLRYDADNHQSSIAVISAEGGEPRVIVPPGTGSEDITFPAAWSPDGERVIFAGFEEAAAIQDVAVDDGSIRTLVGNDGYEYRFPQWAYAAPAPEPAEAQQTPVVWTTCGAGGQSGTDLDLNFLRDVVAAQAAGLTVYWLGTEFTADAQVFRGPYGSESGDEVEGGGVSFQYISWLDGTPGRGSNTSLEITVYSKDTWIPRTPGASHKSVTVLGKQADMFAAPGGASSVNALWLALDLGDVVVIARANALTAPDGAEINPFINNPDLLVQVMQGLRPYPE